MYNMTIRLQADSDVCLYEQIYLHIKREIKEGKLLAGERLPSTRSLAEFLQIARSTVDTAYGQLLDEGYIEARPCRGYFVCSIEDMMEVSGEEESLTLQREPLSSISRTEAEEGISMLPGNQEGAKRKKFDIDFSPYDIEMQGFPFDTWKRITKKILSEANSELFARGEPQGDYELRQTLCRYLHSSRGVKCRPEQIIVGAGNDYLLMLLEKILGRHKIVAMENPTYLRSQKIFRSFAYQIKSVDMDEGGMKVDSLEEDGADVVYVMPSHQFPSGTIMPIGRRNELLKWAGKAAGRYIIEDDYDSEFRYHGRPIPALQSSDESGRVIYLGSFSKAIAPAIRVSFMVLPDVLLERYQRDCFFYSCTVSRIDQSILNEFIRDGYFERHLNKMRKIYRAKHAQLLACLEPFRGRFAITGENAGLHLLLTADSATEDWLVGAASDCGVKVYGLSQYRSDQSDVSKTVLLGFGALSGEQIAEGIRRLRVAWNI